MTGIVLTCAHRLTVNEWNVAIERSRREYEVHPSLLGWLLFLVALVCSPVVVIAAWGAVL